MAGVTSGGGGRDGRSHVRRRRQGWQESRREAEPESVASARRSSSRRVDRHGSRDGLDHADADVAILPAGLAIVNPDSAPVLNLEHVESSRTAPKPASTLAEAGRIPERSGHRGGQGTGEGRTLERSGHQGGTRDNLITYKAQQMVSFSPSFPVTPAEAGGKRESTSIQGPWIPAFAGMTGFRRACARVSIGPGAQAELCA